MHFLRFHQFQKNEKGHDDLFSAFTGFQQCPEICAGMCLQISPYVQSLVIQADFLPPDLSEPAPDRVPAAFFPAQDFPEDFLQALQVRVPQQFIIIDGRTVIQHFPGKLLSTEIAHASLFPVHSQLFGQILVHLVFEETADQLFTGISLFLAGLIILLTGKEHTAFNIQKSRGHDKKFAGHIQILMVHLTDIFEILVCYSGDGNIVNIYFVFFNQVQEKVQRTLEHRELNRNRHNFILARRFRCGLLKKRKMKRSGYPPGSNIKSDSI